MTLYYSKSTGGFYTDAVHDTIPPDAVEISEDDHAALLAAQATGQVITVDATGNPIAEAMPAIPLTVEQQIIALERQQTPRRMREAALNYDSNNWLRNLDSEITALRMQLPKT
jgi:hypothetical protein